MTLGGPLRRPNLPTTGARWCEAALREGLVDRFLARERTRLFPRSGHNPGHRDDATGRDRGAAARLPPALAAMVRDLLQRDGDDRAPGEPACDWADRAARERLVDALVRDAYRAHYALRGDRDPRVADRDSAYGTGAHLVWLRQVEHLKEARWSRRR